jgi:hypothetical protein
MQKTVKPINDEQLKPHTTSSTTSTTSALEPKLLNQGGYGCIYYPSLPVALKNTKLNSSKKYISKLQKAIYQAGFEDFVGKIIQTIPSYKYFFVPVLKTYKIDLATINEESIRKCDAITKFIKKQKKSTTSFDMNTNISSDSSHDDIKFDYDLLNKNFVIQKIEYIDGAIDLKKYLYKLIQDHINASTASSRFVYDDEHDEQHKHDDEQHKQDDEQHKYDDDNTDDDDNHRQANTDEDYEFKQKAKKNQKKALNTDRNLRKHIQQTLLKVEKEEDQQTHKLSYKLVSIMFDCYERLLDCIQLLGNHNIVHNDLKYNNVLLNTEILTPMIIDFGLSIYITKLLENPWRESNEPIDKSKTIKTYSLDNDVQTKKNNYYWKKHFYTHAPDYYLWPIELHIISFLIIEVKTLTYEDLQRISYIYTYNHESLEYMSKEFKIKFMHLCISVYKKYLNKPREEVINKLIQYWPKWDIYAHNVMFIKLFCSVVIKGNKEYTGMKGSRGGGNKNHEKYEDDNNFKYSKEHKDGTFESPYSEDKQKTYITPHSNIQNENIQNENIQNENNGYNSHGSHGKYKSSKLTNARTPLPELNLDEMFESNKIVLKSYYFLKDNKILDIMEFMLWNIHPDPDKRLLPEQAKAIFNSIFYYC